MFVVDLAQTPRNQLQALICSSKASQWLGAFGQTAQVKFVYSCILPLKTGRILREIGSLKRHRRGFSGLRGIRKRHLAVKCRFVELRIPAKRRIVEPRIKPKVKSGEVDIRERHASKNNFSPPRQASLQAP
tara:strand:- start:635 stop:1027 length:393 start_codon:yes stop_codon:yes gene_type:complete